MSLIEAHRIWARPEHRIISLIDPTCPETENFRVAILAAATDGVGWSANSVMVSAACEQVEIAVDVQLWSDAPPDEDEADTGVGRLDLLREQNLALPGGFISVAEAVEAPFRLGLEITTGPGTYAVRVTGYGRARARDIWHTAMGDADSFPANASAALPGVEHYRVQLWQISPQPRWEDDEDSA